MNVTLLTFRALGGGIGKKCRTNLLILFTFLITALPTWAKSVVQESVTIANADGVELNYKLYDDNTTWLLGATSDITTLNIPAKVTYDGQEYKVTAIGSRAFKWKRSLTTVSGGENITEIYDSAFEGCYMLTSNITFNNVTLIGAYAFNTCGDESLNLTFKDIDCKAIGSDAFYNISGAVNLNGTVKIIDPNAFKAVNNDENYVVNADLSGITDIYQNAFEQIKGGEINLELNNATIQGNVFIDIENTNIKIKGSISSILDYSFSRCSGDQLICEIYNSTADWVNENTFEGCDFLLSAIYVPASLRNDYINKKISNVPIEKFDNSHIQTINGIKYAVRTDEPSFEVIGTEDGTVFTDGIVNLDVENIYNLPVTSIKDNAFGEKEINYICVPKANYETIHANAAEVYKNKVYVYGGKVDIVDGDDKVLEVSDCTIYQPGDITYTRTFASEGQYATMCLPIDLPTTEAQQKFEQVYVPQGNIIHNTSTGKYILMLLNPEGEKIPAGTPFFVKTKDAEVTLKNEAVYFMTATPAITSLTVVDWDGKSGLMTQCPDVNVTCSGTLAARTDLDDTYYTFKTDGSFGNQRADSNFPAYRMYLNITAKNSQAAPIRMSIGIFGDDDNTTGIMEVVPAVMKKSAADGIYTIDGRTVNGALSKGLYIVNGKKVVVE